MVLFFVPDLLLTCPVNTTIMKYFFFIVLLSLFFLRCKRDIYEGLSEEEKQTLQCIRSIPYDCLTAESPVYFKGSIDGEPFCRFADQGGYRQIQNKASVLVTTGPILDPTDPKTRRGSEYGYGLAAEGGVPYFKHLGDKIVIIGNNPEVLSEKEFIEQYFKVGPLPLQKKRIGESENIEELKGFRVEYSCSCREVLVPSHPYWSNVWLQEESQNLVCKSIEKTQQGNTINYRILLHIDCRLLGWSLPDEKWVRTLQGEMALNLVIQE